MRQFFCTTIFTNIFFCTIALSCFELSVAHADDQFEVAKLGDKVEIKLNGKPFTTYQTKLGAKPILWPIIGPTGTEMTRAYPQVADGKEGERKDHVHHRSFWFTHGDVNGISFWHENDKHGTTVHREFKQISGGKKAIISTVNDWVGPDKKKHCEDHRTYTFWTAKDKRYVDVAIKVVAAYGDVTFGDTKEGCFGVRTAGTMKVDAKQGGKIVSSNGLTDGEAWGKPASWVDYHGPVDGEKVGIAILNHPKSYGYPSHWHVRTYGLFAANPFGLNMFKTGKNGTLKLKKGDSFSLYYRVIFHKGDEKDADISGEFTDYTRLTVASAFKTKVDLRVDDKGKVSIGKKNSRTTRN